MATEPAARSTRPRPGAGAAPGATPPRRRALLEQARIAAAGLRRRGRRCWRELARGAGAVAGGRGGARPAGGRRSWPALLAQQPPWSDFPLLVFTARAASARQNVPRARGAGRAGQRHRARAAGAPGTLVSAVRAALRARQRQYEAAPGCSSEREPRCGHRDQLPGHAGPRAAQPAVGHPARQRAAEPRRAGWTRRSGRVCAVIERQIRPPDPPGRRSARRRRG